MALPFAEAEFDILFNHGIDKGLPGTDVGIECGVVEKKAPGSSMLATHRTRP